MSELRKGGFGNDLRANAFCHHVGVVHARMFVPRRSQRRIDPDATAVVPYEVNSIAASGAFSKKAAAFPAAAVAGIIVNIRTRGPTAPPAIEVKRYTAPLYIAELNFAAASATDWHRLLCAGTINQSASAFSSLSSSASPFIPGAIPRRTSSAWRSALSASKRARTSSRKSEGQNRRPW